MFKRKRVQAAVIAFCMVMTLVSMPVFAQVASGKCGETVSYSYDSSTNELTITGTGDMKQYSLTSPAPWYSFCEDIVSLNIESGVESIGSYAFYYCKGLINVKIPDSVTTIGEYAFLECVSLASVTISNSVTTIGKGSFQNCTGLTNVTIPGSVINIDEYAFSSCNSLTNVTIQNGTKSIGTFAFSGCRNLNNITLPDSVVSIGDNAFQYTGLYNDDSEWEVLYIGNHLIKADDWALNKGNISDYAIKPGTKTIADNVFSGCGSLKSITIPDSVVSIGNYAFKSCSGLTGMAIPKNVIRIGNCAFQTCIGLTNISVADGNSAYCSENGILYNKEKTEIICFPKNKSDNSFEIPDGITTISDGAFERCWNLTNVTIPNGVKTIGDDAFNYCEALTSITIPDGVTSIGNYTFFNCSSLTSVTIPNSVTSIGDGAFEGCLKSIKINYIGNNDDWNEVMGTGKDILTAANIIFCSGISAKHSEDKKNIHVKPINIAAGKTVILALYDGDKFVEMQQSNEYSETNREITFIPTKPYTCAKVMIWNSLNSMSPVCGAYTVK